MTSRKIAVLGCNSFAGATFVAYALSQGIDVVGINRSKEPSSIFLPYKSLQGPYQYQFFKADLNHDLSVIVSILEDFTPDTIVDFAGQGMVAESWANPEQWYQTNLISKVKLYQKLRFSTWLKKYIKVSTPEVYGSHDTLVKESFDYSPSTPYAISHAAVDMTLKAFFTQYGFPVVFTRFANFYGPSQQLYRIIPRTIIYALLGKKLALHGGGLSKRAFIFGADVASGLMQTINKGEPGHIYHFSPERFYSIREVVEIICSIMGAEFSELVEIAGERPGKDMAYFMDSSKARRGLEWSDIFSLEEGIKETIKWVQSSMHEISTAPLEYIHKV